MSFMRWIAWFPPLFARLAAGYLFLSSGWGKLHELARFQGYLAQLAMPRPELLAPFVASVEFACGALLMIGLASRLAAIPLIVDMIVALAVVKAHEVHRLDGLIMMPELLLIVLLAWIAIAGPGALSFDHEIWEIREKRRISALQNSRNRLRRVA